MFCNTGRSRALLHRKSSVIPINSVPPTCPKNPDMQAQILYIAGPKSDPSKRRIFSDLRAHSYFKQSTRRHNIPSLNKQSKQEEPHRTFLPVSIPLSITPSNVWTILFPKNFSKKNCLPRRAEAPLHQRLIGGYVVMQHVVLQRRDVTPIPARIVGLHGHLPSVHPVLSSGAAHVLHVVPKRLVPVPWR